jgi:hypothetical protein
MKLHIQSEKTSLGIIMHISEGALNPFPQGIFTNNKTQKQEPSVQMHIQE